MSMSLRHTVSTTLIAVASQTHVPALIWPSQHIPYFREHNKESFDHWGICPSLATLQSDEPTVGEMQDSGSQTSFFWCTRVTSTRCSFRSTSSTMQGKWLQSTSHSQTYSRTSPLTNRSYALQCYWKCFSDKSGPLVVPREILMFFSDGSADVNTAVSQTLRTRLFVQIWFMLNQKKQP